MTSLSLSFFFIDECLGLDTLKNALKLFESWKILTYRLQNSQKLYCLCQYYNDAFKLKDIIDRIAKYKSWIEDHFRKYVCRWSRWSFLSDLLKMSLYILYTNITVNIILRDEFYQPILHFTLSDVFRGLWTWILN